MKKGKKKDKGWGYNMCVRVFVCMYVLHNYVQCVRMCVCMFVCVVRVCLSIDYLDVVLIIYCLSVCVSMYAYIHAHTQVVVWLCINATCGVWGIPVYQGRLMCAPVV